MNTEIEILNKPTYSVPPIKYSISEAALLKLENTFLSLKVAGVEDKEGYEKCRRARSEVRRIRLAVEEERKAQKLAALEHGRAVDSAAKIYSERCERIESYLKSQEAIIDEEKKRIEAEAIKKATERLNARLWALQKVRAIYDITLVEQMTDNLFEDLLNQETKRFQDEEKARAEEQARLKFLEEERREKEAKIKALEAEQNRLKDEMIAKQKIEAAEKERELAAEREARRLEQVKAENDRIERERIEAERLAAEKKKASDEAKAKADAEAAAARKVKDKKLFEEIKAEFPTLESAWVEIAKLRKELIGRDEAA